MSLTKALSMSLAHIALIGPHSPLPIAFAHKVVSNYKIGNLSRAVATTTSTCTRVLVQSRLAPLPDPSRTQAFRDREYWHTEASR